MNAKASSIVPVKTAQALSDSIEKVKNHGLADEDGAVSTVNVEQNWNKCTGMCEYSSPARYGMQQSCDLGDGDSTAEKFRPSRQRWDKSQHGL